LVIQAVVDIVEILVKQGVKHAVLCPGSRSAAITLAFARNPAVACISIVDERSAGFVALGIALKTHSPVAIVCTSGSAVYNLAPAVAEAYFQEIPLIILSGDRPLEWIHQNDGQTIYQNGIFGKHVKESFQILADTTHPDQLWYSHRIGNEAYWLSVKKPIGPVHLNIHIREPFYPSKNETYLPSNYIRIIQKTSAINLLCTDEKASLVNELKKHQKILIAIGQSKKSNKPNNHSKIFNSKNGIIVLADSISNTENSTKYHDHYLNPKNVDFCPDLLITIGESFISKSFKKYLLVNKPKAHWHFNEGSVIKDTFQTITKVIDTEVASTLELIIENCTSQNEYSDIWQRAEQDIAIKMSNFFKANLVKADLCFYYLLLQNLPLNCNIHLANSMAIRYANILGFRPIASQEVFANRGTSGIDGCLSTAVGVAMANSDTLNVVFIGDLAFQYDKNALWNKNLPSNLRIVIMNNSGGGIFRLIDGPRSQPELEEFFETQQKTTAKNTVIDSGIDYYSVESINNFESLLQGFFAEKGKSKCLEIFTDPIENQVIFEKFKADLSC
jgi:2-succinyl-5-enolpyruvyl-6-hydroxy-3-cyclohexene-1-carboxylate synthase